MKLDDSVFSLTFSGDANYLAVATQSHAARIYKVSDEREIARFAYSDLPPRASYDLFASFKHSEIAFSANDKFLITAQTPGNVEMRLWRTEDLVKQTCDRLTIPEPTTDEWRYYLGDELGKDMKSSDVCLR